MEALIELNRFERTEKVLIVGAGAAGLAAADELSLHGIQSEIVETQDEVGGHARRFSCKATDRCVRCGVCIVDHYVKRTFINPNIHFHLNSKIIGIHCEEGFCVEIIENNTDQKQICAQAILVATGYQPFDARIKPYGYGINANVLTNYDVEYLLRREGILRRPSDGRIPKRISFIQCVGSRDAHLCRLWCSKVCCGSAIRLSQRIRYILKDVECTVFYIDIQNITKDFHQQYEAIRNEIMFIRAIPGDVVVSRDGIGCTVSYFNPHSGKFDEIDFDMVILSIGISPGKDVSKLSMMTGWPISATGFLNSMDRPQGLFCAGAIQGPMSIAESISSGKKSAWDIMTYLRHPIVERQND
jgi:heterodisulfide reductase subunit A